jgi:hypothetical protein
MRKHEVEQQELNLGIAAPGSRVFHAIEELSVCGGVRRDGSWGEYSLGGTWSPVAADLSARLGSWTVVNSRRSPTHPERRTVVWARAIVAGMAKGLETLGSWRRTSQRMSLGRERPPSL